MNKVREVGKLIVTSQNWPTSLPWSLRDCVKLDKTSKNNYRCAQITYPNGKEVVLIECNPEKVKTDSHGNTARDKVMFKEKDSDVWAGQVRKFFLHKENWHIHWFNKGNLCK